MPSERDDLCKFVVVFLCSISCNQINKVELKLSVAGENCEVCKSTTTSLTH